MCVLVHQNHKISEQRYASASASTRYIEAVCTHVYSLTSLNVSYYAATTSIGTYEHWPNLANPLENAIMTI